jgi:hypothetical protein
VYSQEGFDFLAQGVVAGAERRQQASLLVRR